MRGGAEDIEMEGEFNIGDVSDQDLIAEIKHRRLPIATLVSPITDQIPVVPTDATPAVIKGNIWLDDQY